MRPMRSGHARRIVSSRMRRVDADRCAASAVRARAPRGQRRTARRAQPRHRVAQVLVRGAAARQPVVHRALGDDSQPERRHRRIPRTIGFDTGGSRSAGSSSSGSAAVTSSAPRVFSRLASAASARATTASSRIRCRTSRLWTTSNVRACGIVPSAQIRDVELGALDGSPEMRDGALGDVDRRRTRRLDTPGGRTGRSAPARSRRRAPTSGRRRAGRATRSARRSACRLHA